MDKAEYVFEKYGTKFHRTKEIVKSLIPGAAAGVFTSLVFHPLDTIQVRQQMRDSKPEGLAEPMSYKGLYKGLGMRLAKTVPMQAATWAIIDAVTKRI